MLPNRVSRAGRSGRRRAAVSVRRAPSNAGPALAGRGEQPTDRTLLPTVTESGSLRFLGKWCAGGVGHRVQRVAEVLVGPERGHRDDAVVGLAESAKPLPPDVGGHRAVLAVPGVVDDQHAPVVRRGGRVRDQELKPTGVDLLELPGRLRQEELQPLHRRVLGTGHRFRPGQRGERLVPVSWQQQTGQVLPESPSPGRATPDRGQR